MEENRESQVKFRLSVIIFAVIIVAILAGCALFSYRSMQKSLYKERTSNVSILMEKTTQNADFAVQEQWNTIYHFRNMFEDVREADAPTIADAKNMLQRMRGNYPEKDGKIVRLFLMDENKLCYQSDKSEPQPWQGQEELDITKANCFISYTELNLGSVDHAHMFFIAPFEPFMIEDRKMVGMGMAVELDFIDLAFDTKDFGEDSVAYVLRGGSQLYSQKKDSALSNETDILGSLVASAEFTQGVKPEAFKKAVETGESGAIFVRYQGGDYYVAYNPLAVGMAGENWGALLIIPYYNVSTGTQSFMTSTILSTLVIALGIGAVVLFIIFLSNHKVRNQLTAAAEAERKANEAKTQFLSAMSHDIRTPMNAIVGMTALAEKRLEEREYVKNCLHKISLASSHLLTLVNDILDITKVESGKMSLNPISFSLAEMVSNLINVIRPLVQEKLHEFEFHVHNISVENVYADQLRLNQIFINILSNAVKYTPEGGRIIVNLREELVEDNPDVVRLTYEVEDNGVGMSEEFQKTMYRSFTREDHLTLQRVQGSGLGLTICKQMVDLMGGIIKCESKEGVGTKFTVVVDLLIADKEMDRLVFMPTEVLLVDDDKGFLLSATDTLLQLGLLPDCASSGAEAVAAVETRHLANNDYPLVIIDWRMPEMDGMETVRQIRQRVGDEISIIVVSAYDTEEIQEEARALGVNGFISKPFFRSSVYNSLKPLLEVDRTSAPEEEHNENPLRGLRILVAEDNELNWEIVKDLLGMYGVITVHAENGQACVDIMENAEDGDYDLILMDIQMPIMNGYDATKSIRASTRKYLQEIPIIAMTADAFSENIQQCKEVGMNAHVSKPVDVNVLLDTIENRGGGA